MLLDKTKPYAEFFYPNAKGMKYEQDGKCYNDKMQQISWDDGSLIKPRAKMAKRKRATTNELPDSL